MFLLWKIGKGVVVLIVVTMGFVALIGERDTRSLADTTAVVGGTSTDIVITDFIPKWIAQVDSEQDDDNSGSGREG